MAAEHKIIFTALAVEETTDKRFLSIMALMLLVSFWLHLMFFIGWQHSGWHWDGFVDPPDHPLMLELTLEMNVPPADVALEPQPPLAPPAATAQTNAADESGMEMANSSQELPDGALDNIPADAEILSDIAAGEDQPPLSAAADRTINVVDEAPKFKSYNRTIKRAVAKQWILPPQARKNFHPARFSTSITINRQGELVKIVVLESSGNTVLDNAGLEALRAAAPYEPFPENLKQFNQLDFIINFDYQATIR